MAIAGLQKSLRHGVWHASGKLGAFGLLAGLCLLCGPRRSEPTMIQWQKHIMDDRITFDEAWT
jgi:hypothetical protein